MGVGRNTAPVSHILASQPPSSARTVVLFLRRVMMLAAIFLTAAYAVYLIHVFPSYCRQYYFHQPAQERKVDLIGAGVVALADPINSSFTPTQLRPTAAPGEVSTAVVATDFATPSPPEMATSLQHVVFGIAASARLWEKRKEYIKVWWQPRRMRGCVWLDKPVKTRRSEQVFFPCLRVSADTSRFPYTFKGGHRSAIRISRIVSEAVRQLPQGPDEVRWLVMGDDDTVFVPDNLVRVLSKYDHRQPYYIGAVSESHLQNIYFSYGMAYGGGGFAISRSLAEALAKTQDRCIARYPALYGSDDRIQACMAELGVPLTREPGFHQYDVYGSLLGLLGAHPVAPLVSLHHLDVVEPVLPGKTRVKALERLFDGPVRLDSAGIMQQSICYDIAGGRRQWTVSVAWGYVVQVIRGVMSPRDVERPTRTFLNWYRHADYTAYAFNTRPVARNPCQKPFVFFLSSTGTAANGTDTVTLTRYERHRGEKPHLPCKWDMDEPSAVERVMVYKRADPHIWDRAPRRNCCRVRSRQQGERTMTVDVGLCRVGEISEPGRQL